MIDYLVFGASMAALGFASSHPNTLIIEETESVGVEYTHTFRSSEYGYIPHTEQGKALLELLQNNGMARADRTVDTISMYQSLCHWCCNHKLNILLDAALVYLTPIVDGWEASVRTNSGLQSFQAHHVIDATNCRITDRTAAKITKKTLNVIVSDTSAEVLNRLKSVNISVTKGYEPGEFVIGFHFQENTTLPDARQEIENIWERSFPDGEALIDSIAPDFDIQCEAAREYLVPWLDPHAFKSPVEAFDAGVKMELLPKNAYAYYELVDNCQRMRRNVVPQIDRYYDLVVAGVGSAGSFCLLSAAQEGLSVLGLERGSCCGGMSTQGTISEYHNGLNGGAFEEIDRQTEAKIGKTYRQFQLHPDAKKIRIEQKLLAAGVDLSFHSVILGVFAQDKSVVAVRALVNGKIQDIGCRFLCDATSEGHILRMMGISSQSGRPSDGQTMPFTSSFMIRSQGAIYRCNPDSGYINPYDAQAFSDSIMRGNASHIEFTKQNHFRTLFVAPQVGIREAMCFLGEDTLTFEDILENRKPENTLCIAFSDADRHGEDHAFDDPLYQDWFTMANLSHVGFKIHIPMGIVVPKGWNGLLTVGRSMSLEGHAAAAVRMNRDMYRIGESVGVAVAMAIRAGSNNIMDIDVPKLQESLKQRGCFDSDTWISSEISSGEPDYQPVFWMEEPEQIRTFLASERHDVNTGVAMWSCRRLGIDTIGDFLYTWSMDKDKRLATRAAICLGMLGDKRSIPALRQIVIQRDTDIRFQNRRFEQLYCVDAICLLGRFADCEIVPELIHILSPAEYRQATYNAQHKGNFFDMEGSCINIAYYSVFSFALKALADITKQHPELRPEVSRAVTESMRDGMFSQCLQNAPQGSTLRVIVQNLSRFALEQGLLK